MSKKHISSNFKDKSKQEKSTFNMSQFLENESIPLSHITTLTAVALLAPCFIPERVLEELGRQYFSLEVLEFFKERKLVKLDIKSGVRGFTLKDSIQSEVLEYIVSNSLILPIKNKLGESINTLLTQFLDSSRFALEAKVLLPHAKHLLKGLEDHSDPEFSKLSLLLTVGKCYMKLSEYDKSIKFFHKALTLNQLITKDKSDYDTAIVLTSIAEAYTKKQCEVYDRMAHSHFKQSLDILNSLPELENDLGKNLEFLHTIWLCVSERFKFFTEDDKKLCSKYLKQGTDSSEKFLKNATKDDVNWTQSLLWKVVDCYEILGLKEEASLFTDKAEKMQEKLEGPNDSNGDNNNKAEINDVDLGGKHEEDSDA